jgi:alpha-N-acetylglucosamine transferase
MMDKKAVTSFNMIVMILRMIFLIVVALVIVIIINVALDLQIDTKETEANILMSRILYSPEGISKYDSITGRVETCIVDVKNMNSTRLDNGIYIENNNRIAAKVQLYRYEGTGKLSTFVAEAKYNRDIYDSLEPVAEAFYNVGGIGGVLIFEKEYPVVIFDKGEEVLGKVEFTVLIPKSAR